MSGIRLVEVRVSNFRSLRQASVLLDALTVLIGENNSGKTSFLEALNAAIGQGRRGNLADDIHIGPTEKQPPRDRVALIDLLIRPVGEAGAIVEKFATESPWLELWGDGIAQDDDDNDFLGIRAQIAWSATKGEFELRRKFLTEWPSDFGKMEAAKCNERQKVQAAHIEPLALYYLDAKRDIQDELQNKFSFWGKLVSDLGLSEERVLELEATLNDLNSAIVTGSTVLAHVQTHLDQLYQTFPCDQGSVLITPLSRHLRDVNKGLDISFKTGGAQSFPLARHGMGTRSLAAVLAFRAYSAWRQLKAAREASHPLLGLEEPESHLHPQAQRALFQQLLSIPGQKIVSTHSPYVVGQAKITSIRHFKKRGAETLVTRFNTGGLSAEDIRKIDRMILNTRGELLYARSVVLFEGETEEQALPVFAGEHWKQHPHSLGVSFVGVGGAGNYLPFLRLLESFEISWAIFSDGEPEALKSVDAALKSAGLPKRSKLKNVVVLPNGQDFEHHMLDSGYEDVIVPVLNHAFGSESAIEDFIDSMHGKKGKGGRPRDYKSAGGRSRVICDMLRYRKTECAGPLARAICELSDAARRVPKKIAEVFSSLPIQAAA